jgi:hypothetical protein
MPRPPPKRTAKKPAAKKAAVVVRRMPPPFNVKVVEQSAGSCAPPETLALSLGISLETLSPEHRELYDRSYARGVAVGVSDMFLGMKNAAVDGDMKAAQLLMDLLNIKPPPVGVDTPTGKPRRVRVEVTYPDADEE